MEDAEGKRGMARKRKATAAGIQSQNKESAAPGSAEVRASEASFLSFLTLFPSSVPLALRERVRT